MNTVLKQKINNYANSPPLTNCKIVQNVEPGPLLVIQLVLKATSKPREVGKGHYLRVRKAFVRAFQQALEGVRYLTRNGEAGNGLRKTAI